ncbi:MAG: dipeptidase [Anaerolineae bacterium]
MSTQDPLSYAHENREAALAQLTEWLAIPSLSAVPAAAPDVRRAADWLAARLRTVGLENVEVVATGGHPVVYADWLHAPGAPTVLVYGHYDVQPVKVEEWATPPFEPTVQDGKLYARGSADDKGQTYVHVEAVEAYLQTVGRLPVNVRFLVEGEEEVGSRNLRPFLTEQADRLRADTVLISDTPWVAAGVPTIGVGLRGGASVEVEVHGPSHDLHSGLHGGAVQNPIHAAAQIIAALHDEHGRVTAPGFYDKVRPLSEAERADMARVPITDEQIIAETGAPRLWGEAGYSVLERMGARPTLDVLKFVAGGDAAAVPSVARFKVAARLVPDQEPAEIAALLGDYIVSLAPDTVRVTATPRAGGPGVLIDPDAPGLASARQAFRETFGAEPVFARSGGGIPVVLMFRTLLDLPCLLMGFGLPDDGLHGPNEKLDLAQFYGGIDASIRFLAAFASETPQP